MRLALDPQGSSGMFRKTGAGNSESKLSHPLANMFFDPRSCGFSLRRLNPVGLPENEAIFRGTYQNEAARADIESNSLRYVQVNSQTVSLTMQRLIDSEPTDVLRWRS